MRFGKPKHLKISKKISTASLKKKGALFEFEGHGYPLSETKISPLKVVSKMMCLNSEGGICDRFLGGTENISNEFFGAQTAPEKAHLISVILNQYFSIHIQSLRIKKPSTRNATISCQPGDSLAVTFLIPDRWRSWKKPFEGSRNHSSQKRSRQQNWNRKRFLRIFFGVPLWKEGASVPKKTTTHF